MGGLSMSVLKSQITNLRSKANRRVAEDAEKCAENNRAVIPSGIGIRLAAGRRDLETETGVTSDPRSLASALGMTMPVLSASSSASRRLHLLRVGIPAVQLRCHAD